MEPEVIIDVIFAKIKNQLQQPELYLSGDNTWEEIGMDSLDVVELVIDLETRFGIDLGMDDYSKLKDIGSFCSVVVQTVEEKRKRDGCL